MPVPWILWVMLPTTPKRGGFLEENLRHASRFVVDEVDCRGGLFCKGRPAGGEKVAQKTPLKINMEHNWLVVSTHLKNISQNGNLPQIGVKINNMGVSENSGFSPQIIHFKKGVPFFSPSILGYLYFWKHPHGTCPHGGLVQIIFNVPLFSWVMAVGEPAVHLPGCIPSDIQSSIPS